MLVGTFFTSDHNSDFNIGSVELGYIYVSLIIASIVQTCLHYLYYSYSWKPSTKIEFELCIFGSSL